MASVLSEITPELRGWIEQQKMFFVASAPLAAAGLVNCSPKGMDSFRVLGPTEVAYLDLTGSGAETLAHIRENQRVTFMFCAFDGLPNIVRLHGRGSIVMPQMPEWANLRGLFPDYPGARSIIRAQLLRISDSCGYAVPRYDHREDRDVLLRWATNKGEAGVRAYQQQNNLRSLDELPALDPEG